MATPSGESAFVLSLAGFMATLPAGLQPEPFVTGMVFSGLGVIMRAGSELQKSSEGTEAIKPSKIFGWVAGGCAATPGVCLVYLIFLQLTGFPANLPELFWLIALGYYGQKWTNWLLSTTTDMGKNALGGIFKLFPSPPKSGGGQP